MNYRASPYHFCLINMSVTPQNISRYDISGTMLDAQLYTTNAEVI